MKDQKEIALFTKINADQIKLLVLIGEALFIGVLVLCYYQNSLLFGRFATVALIFNVLTFFPFPSILKRLKFLKTKSEIMDNPNKESTTNNLDKWERTCIGFYVVANSGMIVFLVTTFFNLW